MASDDPGGLSQCPNCEQETPGSDCPACGLPIEQTLDHAAWLAKKDHPPTVAIDYLIEQGWQPTIAAHVVADIYGTLYPNPDEYRARKALNRGLALIAIGVGLTVATFLLSLFLGGRYYWIFPALILWGVIGACRGAYGLVRSRRL